MNYRIWLKYLQNTGKTLRKYMWQTASMSSGKYEMKEKVYIVISTKSGKAKFYLYKKMSWVDNATRVNLLCTPDWI